MNGTEKERESKKLLDRKILYKYPQVIIKSPDTVYFDVVTHRHIAVKKLNFAHEMRYLVVAYDIIGDTIEAITIHPVPKSELNNKIKNGRWITDEKN